MGERESKGAEQQQTAGRGWAQRIGLPALGALTLGALATCIASGIVVATAFEPARPVASILEFELSRPYGWFFRALHAWSAHLSLIGLVAHTVEYVTRKGERQTSIGTWALLTATVPITGYLMLGGRALVGDTEAGGVASVMHGLLSAIPLFGSWAADVFVGPMPSGDMHGLLTHHVTTATMVLLVITVVHLRRLVPDAVSTGLAVGIAGGFALAVRPALSVSPTPTSLRGPWFMGGLRLLLEHAPAWTVGLVLPACALVLLGLLPVLSEPRARIARFVLAGLAASYAILTGIAGWT